MQTSFHVDGDQMSVPGRRGGSRTGTGVGLAVVRGLVEAMGGSVAARKSELGGLAMDVRLPIAERPQPEPESDGASNGRGIAADGPTPAAATSQPEGRHVADR